MTYCAGFWLVGDNVYQVPGSDNLNLKDLIESIAYSVAKHVNFLSKESFYECGVEAEFSPEGELNCIKLVVQDLVDFDSEDSNHWDYDKSAIPVAR